MKQLRTYLAIISIAIMAAGCTQNNGNIGRLFGSWVLDEATLDGAPLVLPEGTETFWSFQGDIIMVTLSHGNHEYSKRYGTFSELPDNIMRLTFTYSSDAVPEGTGIYGAPEWLGFPSSGVFDLSVADSPKNRLVLTYSAPGNGIYIYKFSKTW